MTDAPKRIWAWTTGIQPASQSAGLWQEDAPSGQPRGTEYIRADLSQAAVEALEAKLAEADDFIAAQAKDHNSNNIRLAEMAHRVRALQAKLSSAVATIAELTGGKDD